MDNMGGFREIVKTDVETAACDREAQGIEPLLCCTAFRQRRCRRALPRSPGAADFTTIMEAEGRK